MRLRVHPRALVPIITIEANGIRRRLWHRMSLGLDLHTIQDCGKIGSRGRGMKHRLLKSRRGDCRLLRSRRGGCRLLRSRRGGLRLLRSRWGGHSLCGCCCRVGFALGHSNPRTAAADLGLKLGFLQLKLLHLAQELLQITELARGRTDPWPREVIPNNYI